MTELGQDAGGRKWWVLVAIGAGTFMSALDGSVVNTVLPVITRSFGVPVATVEWVVVVYLLIVSGLLLTFGRLGDLNGHKPVYLAGFAVFVVSSALCGLAPSAELLVAARGLQALGAAMLFANAPAILTKTFPARQRGQALGMQATMTYLGLTVGPSFGGWLAESLGWRAVFYINVPVGIVAVLLSLRFIPDLHPEKGGERFDVAGAACFMAGLVSLLLALNRGAEWGWGSAKVLVLLAAAAGLLVLFATVERRSRWPMVDFSLFGSRVFTASAVSALLNYICLYCIIFLLPFYLIQGRGLSSGQAGLLLTAQPLAMAIAAPLSGTLSDRIGSRLLATLGMLVLSCGLLFLSRLGSQSGLPVIAMGLATVGLGTGVFVSPNNSALMGAAPRGRQGIAAGILATARNVGMVLGVGLAGAILTTLQGSSAGAEAAGSLFTAVRAGFVVAAVLALVGAATSAMRGRAAG